MSTTLRGIVPPLVTPFTADNEIDILSLRNLVEHQIAAGVHGLFALGSSGEVAYLDDEQRAVVLKEIVEVAAGRVPVLAGAIDLTTARVRAQVRNAVALGVDGVVVTAPIYALNNTEEIEYHFREIAAHSPVPVYAYDIPVRVKTKLDTAMLVRLGSEGVIAGVKDSSGDDVAFRRLVAANRAAGSPLTVLTGHEVVVDGMLLLGADGAVPGLANVDAAGYVRLWNAAQAGDWVSVQREQEQLAALFEIVAQPQGRSGDATGIGAFKTAMQLQGLITNRTMAYPIEQLDNDDAARVEQHVRALGLSLPEARLVH